MSDYWRKILDQRVDRRRALLATGGFAAGAAFLAACGGSDDKSSSDALPSGDASKPDRSGLVAKPEDTSKSAKRGGTYKWSSASEPLHFDGSVQGQAQLNVFNGLAYGSLVQNKPGVGIPSTYSEVVGDLAESWEVSADRLSLTFKLRQGVKWHNKAPVNGRDFDSSDVVANWKRYEAKGGNRAANANSANPNAPIISVTAPDARTVVYKLKEPTSFLLQRLAIMTTGEAGTQMPRETDNGFDPRQEQIGTGGFILDKYEPSVRLIYKRNPDYWNKQEPYVDTLEIPFVTQYASGLAQFKAGNVYSYNVLPQDQVAAKKETPATSMYQFITATANPAAIVGFGWNNLPNGQKSPFLDVRVRQALSMSYDRDAFIDAFSNVSKFESEGLPVETYYYTAMAYVPNVWLDPRKSDFGPNAQFYKQNIAEAKKLVAAAGYDHGIDFESKVINGAQFGLDHQKQVEVMDNMAREAGFRPTPKLIDYNLEYLPKIVTSRGKFDGYAYRFGATSSSDPLDFFVWRYWSKAGPTSGALGFDVNGKGDDSGDPAVDQLIEKGMAEVDAQKRTEYIKELQRYLGKMQYGVSRPGNASQFALAWPAVGNYQVFQGDSRAAAANSGGTPYTWWLDETKEPLKK